MTYPSQSLTERWISMIVAEGGEVPTSFGLGELMKAYAEAEGGGSGGYASLTGAGKTATPGELDQAGAFTVTVPEGDTVGIQLGDNGTGGVGLSSVGGPIVLDGSVGIVLIDSGASGITVTETVGAIVFNIGDFGVVSQVSMTSGGDVTANATSGTIALTGAHSSEIEIGSGILIDPGSTAQPLLMPHLPTADPHIVDQVWNNAGVLTLSAG